MIKKVGKWVKRVVEKVINTFAKYILLNDLLFDKLA